MSGAAHSDVVTGDAVVLDLRLAKLASRSLALAIDLTVQGFLAFLGFAVIGGLLATVDDALAAAIGLVFTLLVILGYPVILETATRGRSLGKLAFGLRVVREDGGPIRFRHAFVRGLLAVVEIWITFGSLALLCSLASAKGKRVGDFLAGTVVIRERMPVRAAAVTPMPPPLAGWAAGLDLSRVPDDLALAARQFLSRQSELAPAVREEMASRLATSMAAVTAPAPPLGTPAWAFLAAVLAERRRRDFLRYAPPPTAWPQQSPYAGWPQQSPYAGWPQRPPPPQQQAPRSGPQPVAAEPERPAPGGFTAPG